MVALIVQYSANQSGSGISGLLSADALSEAGWETHVAFAFKGPLIEIYKERGHRTAVVPHNNWLRHGRTDRFLRDAWQEWRKAHAFESLMEEVHPDAVYINTVVSLAGAVAARRAGVPCIWHLREMFADIGGEMHAPPWGVPIVRRVIRWHADRLAANSAATAQNLMGPLARQAVSIPNAVRSAFFDESRSQAAARDALGLSADDVIVGVPGTLRPMKGHLFCLDAMAPLLHRHPSMQVAITGEGDEKVVAHIKERVRELQIEPRVHFLGWVSDMPAFYRACDIACIPSRAEPFGRTAIEAFAVSTPVVATAVGGLKDIVADGETGWLVPYGDRDALRDAVQEAVHNPDVRQKMSVNARQVADVKYHEKVYKKRIVELVSDQVREDPRTPPE